MGWLAAAMMLTACGESTPAQPAAVEQVRSANSVTIVGDAREAQELLIAGVRGPDRDAAPQAAQAARDAVEALLSRGGLSHAPVGDPDRYGRTPSHITLSEGADLAQTLLGAGWVMVWPRQGQDVLYDRLLEVEAEARANNAGAWGQGAFAVRDTDPNRLAQYLDSAQIIEGRVIDVGSARDGRVFINFGLDWRTDLTAVADEDAVARFNQAGLDLTLLEAPSSAYAAGCMS